jgi:hypothetical protein
MNVINKGSHDITFFSSRLSSKYNFAVPECDITNHIPLQNTVIMSLNKPYAIEKQCSQRGL